MTINQTDTTSGVGTAYPLGVAEFTLKFVRVAQSVVSCVLVYLSFLGACISLSVVFLITYTHFP